jgi:predicted lipoprotein
VVLQVFQGHAQVQLQGSTSKGTSLQDSSDWDFFVRLNSNIDTVTSRQRMAVHDQLRVQLDAAGISYRMQCGENRIRLFDGRDAAGVLPDCDVVFQRFKSDLRVPPNNKALASSHPAQQVSVCSHVHWLLDVQGML